MQIIEDDGVEESQEDAVEVDPDDSVDGGVLVNGNDGEEHWGMNNKELICMKTVVAEAYSPIVCLFCPKLKTKNLGQTIH
jgi:hypothetical protein